MVARVAEVAAFIPGPVGTVAGFVSAGAYLATGNTRKAAEMAITGAANMVGAGLAFRAAVKIAGSAAKIGRKAARIVKAVRSKGGGSTCRNSFTSDTPVLMADGLLMPIAEVQRGDFVWAEDPNTGQAGPREVLGIISYTTLHLMVSITLEDGERIEATELHPFWNSRSRVWVDAIDIVPGDLLQDVEGEQVVVAGVATYTAENQAHNLSIDDLRTYFAGDSAILTHNCTLPTSRAARREAMRLAGIPTSMTPLRQIKTKAGYSYEYRVNGKTMVVSRQTTDRVAGHKPHWEAGKVKSPLRRDPYGRLRVYNSKSMVNYGKR